MWFFDDEAFEADVLAAQEVYAERCRLGKRAKRKQAFPAEARGSRVQGVRSNERPVRGNWAWDARQLSR